MSESGQQATLARLRNFLLAILLLGLLGTEAELLLTAHTEDARQWIPVTLLALALVTVAWHVAARQPRASVRALQTLMALFLLAGVLGIIFHMQGKMEFKHESDPSLAGWKLLTASLDSKTPPALAPGVMIQLGLLGLACVWRHPSLGAPPPEK